MEEVVYIELD